MIENLPKSVQGKRYKGIGSREVPNEFKKQTDHTLRHITAKWEKLKTDNSKGRKKKVLYKGIPIRNQTLLEARVSGMIY